MVKNQNKGNDMDKYKDEVKQIATDTKLNDQDFQTKVISEELKAANVKVKDDSFKNVLSAFTTESSSKSTSDSEKESTKSSETKETESTKASDTEESTTESSSK